MPFDFQKYDQKCQGMDQEELQREWQHYTRLISGASTSTAVSGLALPLTAGVSAIGIGLAAPAIHNARKKRDIIERHLNRLGATHNTRKRDVFSGVAVSGTIGVVTLGVGTAGADAVATAGADAGISAIVENETAIKIATHAALDGAGMGLEHMYTHHVKAREAKKAFEKAGVFQAVADAKAQEAGYATQPYRTPTQGFEYGYDGHQMAPPPPYYAVTAPAGFVPDTKTPAFTYTQDPSSGYSFSVPAPPQYSYAQQPPASSFDTPQQGYTIPPTYMQAQSGVGDPTQRQAAQNPDTVQDQLQDAGGLAYQTHTISTQPSDPNSVGHIHGLQAAQAPVGEPGRDGQQNQEQAWRGQPPELHPLQQTASPPQTSPAPAQVHPPSQVAAGLFDMGAMACALPTTVPAPEQQHQQLPTALQQPGQQHQDQHHIVAVSTQPESGSQIGGHSRSQSVSYQHLRHFTSSPAETLGEAPVAGMNVPETPTLHAPQPNSAYDTAARLTEYASQSTPAVQQHQQGPVHTPQASHQDLPQQSPPQMPPHMDGQQYSQPAGLAPLQPLAQPQYHYYGQPVHQPTQLEGHQTQQQQILQAPQPQLQYHRQYQASPATLPPSLEQQQAGVVRSPANVPPPLAPSTQGPPPASYHASSPPLPAPVPPLPAPFTGVLPPPPPPASTHQQPAALGSYTNGTTSQRPASMIYFPPPPTIAAPKIKQAPPPPAHPPITHRLSFPQPSRSTAPPPPIQGYANPGDPYAPIPLLSKSQPLVQHQPYAPEQYQYQQQYQTPQPHPQRSHPVTQQPPHQPQQATAQHHSYPSHPQQQTAAAQPPPPPPPPPPPQATAFPPTPLSPPQSAQHTGQGYFTPQNPHQQQHAGTQSPPSQQGWNASVGSGQQQWSAQAPYTPAATPAWTGY